MLELKNQPVAQATLLIRKPVAEVFAAFVDPEITTKFWFSRGTGPLGNGQTVNWYWDIYGVSAEVRVTVFEPNERIEYEWASGPDDATMVEYHFDARTEDTTFVRIRNQGFGGDGDTAVAAAIDSTSGFTLVLAAAKAYLEHGVELNVVADGH